VNKKKRTRVEIRLTPEEKKKIQEYAKEDHLTVSNYIKNTAMRKIFLANRVEYTSELRGLNFQIAKVGNNVNQIAKHLNTVKETYPGDFSAFQDVMARYLEKMAEAERLLKRMYAKLAGL